MMIADIDLPSTSTQTETVPGPPPDVNGNATVTGGVSAELQPPSATTGMLSRGHPSRPLVFRTIPKAAPSPTRSIVSSARFSFERRTPTSRSFVLPAPTSTSGHLPDPSSVYPRGSARPLPTPTTTTNQTFYLQPRWGDFLVLPGSSHVHASLSSATSLSSSPFPSSASPAATTTTTTSTRTQPSPSSPSANLNNDKLHSQRRNSSRVVGYTIPPGYTFPPNSGRFSAQTPKSQHFTAITSPPYSANQVQSLHSPRYIGSPTFTRRRSRHKLATTPRRSSGYAVMQLVQGGHPYPPTPVWQQISQEQKQQVQQKHQTAYTSNLPTPAGASSTPRLSDYLETATVTDSPIYARTDTFKKRKAGPTAEALAQVDEPLIDERAHLSKSQRRRISQGGILSMSSP